MLNIRYEDGSVGPLRHEELKTWLQEVAGVHPYVADRVAARIGRTPHHGHVIHRAELHARSLQLASAFAAPSLYASIAPTDILSGIGTAAGAAGDIVKLLGGGYEETVPGSGCYTKTPGIPFIDVDHTAPAMDVVLVAEHDCDPTGVEPSLGETIAANGDTATACPGGSGGKCIRIKIVVSDYGGWFGGDTTGVRKIDICNIHPLPGGRATQGPCRHIKLTDEQIEQSKTEEGVKLSIHICVPLAFIVSGRADFLINATDGAGNGTAYYKSCAV